MARTVKDTRLDSRSARLRLAPRHEPYWRLIDKSCHLGYRKGPKAASWVARLRTVDGYRKDVIGQADDGTDADGVKILTYFQALERARAKFEQFNREAAGLDAKKVGPLTVSEVMADYLAWAKLKGGSDSWKTSETCNRVHIEPKLGRIEVAQLTTRKISQWHAEMAGEAARLRSRHDADVPNRRPLDDAESRRRRQVTANRNLNILRAALNRAWRQGMIASSDAWRRVEPFRKVEAPKIRYLSVDEVKRLVNACDPVFRPLVQAALFTGCRYGELCSMLVGDFNVETGLLFVHPGKTGKSRVVTLNSEAVEFFKHQIVGVPPSKPMFRVSDGTPWLHSLQKRRMTTACIHANIAPAISFHVLRHTHASLLAMAGVPLLAIAQQLGHADTRITSRHYAHLSPSYVSEAVRQNFPLLGIIQPSNIVALQPIKHTGP